MPVINKENKSYVIRDKPALLIFPVRIIESISFIVGGLLMKNDRLVICIIVQDKEYLHRCLDSVKELSHTLIIINYEDSINLSEIIKRYQLDVQIMNEKEWVNFSNNDLVRRGADWVLYIKGDEELSPGSADSITKLLNRGRVTGYTFQIVDRFKDQLVYIPEIIEESCRLCFIGIGGQEPGVIKTDFRIYQNRLTNPETDYLSKILQETGNLNYCNEKAYYNFKMGHFFLRKRKYKEALYNLRLSSQSLKVSLKYQPGLVRNLAISFLELEEYNDLISLIKRELSLYPDYTDLIYLKALAEVRLKKYNKALHSFQRCLISGEVSERYISSNGVGSFFAHFGLGQIHEKFSEKEEAIAQYFSALELNAVFRKPVYPLVKLLQDKYGNTAQALVFLKQHTDVFNVQDKALLADLCSFLKEDRLALFYLESLKRKKKFNGHLRVIYARSLLGSKKYTKSKREYQDLLSDSDIWESETRVRNKIIFEYFLSCWLSDLSLSRWAGLKEDSIKKFFQNKVLKKSEAYDLSQYLIEELILMFLDRCLRFNETEVFKSAIRLFDLMEGIDDGRIQYLIGELYYLNGDYNNALPEFNKSLEYGVTERELFYYVGSIFEKKDLFNDAEKYYQKAIDSNIKVSKYNLAAARVALKKEKKLAELLLKGFNEPHFYSREIEIINYCLRRL